jgi:hypothetical protein
MKKINKRQELQYVQKSDEPSKKTAAKKGGKKK